MIAGWLAGLWVGRRLRISEDRAKAFRAHEANLELSHSRRSSALFDVQCRLKNIDLLNFISTKMGKFSFDPHERFGVLVANGNVSLNSVLKLIYAAMAAATNLFFRQFGKPPLYHIKP